MPVRDPLLHVPPRIPSLRALYAPPVYVAHHINRLSQFLPRVRLRLVRCCEILFLYAELQNADTRIIRIMHHFLPCASSDDGESKACENSLYTVLAAAAAAADADNGDMQT